MQRRAAEPHHHVDRAVRGASESSAGPGVMAQHASMPAMSL
ncbi:MAG: hypothetical protein ACOZQL_19355 [Myxococcota bacterium]